MCLEWSPYSFLTPTELEERHKRRNEELARAKSALMDPVVKKLSDSGVESVETEIKYGHIAKVHSPMICESDPGRHADRYRTGWRNQPRDRASLARSPARLAHMAAPVPCTIVP